MQASADSLTDCVAYLQTQTIFVVFCGAQSQDVLLIFQSGNYLQRCTGRICFTLTFEGFFNIQIYFFKTIGLFFLFISSE